MIHKALHQIDDEDYICQRKEAEAEAEEEDSSVLKIAWMHQYEDLKTTLKRAKKN